MKKRTVTLRRITTEQFEQHFLLEGPGWRLALESDAAGELKTSIDRLEAVCLLNKLYAINLQNAIIVSLKPFGTASVERYFELRETERAPYLVATIGEQAASDVLKEVIVQTRAQAGIGTNDKYPPPDGD